MVGVSRHISEHVNVINNFHDVNSFLHTTHPITRILLKILNVLRGKNEALFMVSSIHSIGKSTKNRNSGTRWNPRCGTAIAKEN